MRDFEELVLHENGHSGLAFRDRAYANAEHEQLIEDLIGLANASVSGPRFLVLGVDVGREQRRLTGISEDDFRALQTLLPRIAARLIEPPLKLALSELAFDGKRIAVVTVQACDDPPYLLSCDLSPGLHAGRGWVRRGSESQPLLRADLQRMFDRRGGASQRVADLAIGFPGRILADEISLPALPLDALPSRVAAERLQRMLEGNAQARDVLGRTETHFSRLLHAQLFGSDQAYEKHSDDSLIGEIERVGDDYAAADLHYEFEQRAHKLQLEIRNNGDFDIEHAALVLSMIPLEGSGVAERCYAAPGVADDGYPLVDASPQRTIVQAEIGRIAAGKGRSVFREPLRIWLREPAAGRTVLIDYKLQCRDLARPLSGSLRIHVEAAAAALPGVAERRLRTA